MRKLNSGVAVSCILLAVTAAHAAVGDVDIATVSSGPTPYYVGVGVGQGRTSLGADLSNTGGLSYNLLGGYQFSRNLAVEVSYVNLGAISTTTGVSGNTSGYGIAGIASFPLSRSISGYGKFGVATLETDWASSPAGSVNSTQVISGLNWGAGLRFSAVKNAEIRVGVDRYVVGSDEPVAGTATNSSLSVLFRY